MTSGGYFAPEDPDLDKRETLRCVRLKRFIEEKRLKIAVTYEDGRIFQHFGRTPAFKLYEVEDGSINSAKVVPTEGTGHGALADMLAGLGVDILICGGIGGGAQTALQEAGIRLFAGAEGDPDQAVADLLTGTLPEQGEANCDHHHGEDHACCGQEDSGCHGGCCGSAEKGGRNVGKKVRTHYRGTFNDGTEFDSSYDRGEPLEFVCGSGMMIPGFDAAVAEMEVGQTVQVHLMPEEAYGPVNPQAVFALPLAQLPGAEALAVGERVVLQNAYGQPIPVKVSAKDETSITFDANHEMAGKELNFTIELVEVLER